MTIGVAAAGSGTKSHSGVRAALALTLAGPCADRACFTGSSHTSKRKSASVAEQEIAGQDTGRAVERLGRLHFVTTFGAGLLLGLGGPKRLVVTGLAATTIAAAGVGNADETVLIVVYVTLADRAPSGPTFVFLLFGKQVIALMEGAEGEVARRQPHITVYGLLVLAALLSSTPSTCY